MTYQLVQEFSLKIARLMQQNKKYQQLTEFLNFQILGIQRQNIKRKGMKKQQQKFTGEVYMIGNIEEFNKQVISNNMIKHKFQQKEQCYFANNNKQQKIPFLINKIQNKQDEQNQFLTQNQPKKKNYFNPHKNYDTQNAFKSLQINQQNKPSMNIKQKQQEEQQFYDIHIKVNNKLVSSSQSLQQYIHHVKILNKDEKQLKKQNESIQYSGNSYNLSNFSSFNGKSRQTNNIKKLNKQQQYQNEFYTKQFIYLIKGIQSKYGKKLTENGIKKVINQLSLIQERTQKIIKQDSNKNMLQKSENQQNKAQFFNNNKKNFKKAQKINCDKDLNNNSRSSLMKMHKKTFSNFQTNQQNSISGVNLIKKDLVQNNKQNQDKSLNKNINRKQMNRSTSPLTYKVLMQKKQSQIKNRKTFASQNLDSKPFNKEITKYQIECSSNKASHLLKIMIQSNFAQNKPKTLFLEYSDLPQQKLTKLVNDYCTSNKISQNNKKTIYQAIQNHKSIVTLRQ